MKTILFMMALLALPVSAHAAWGNAEMHPVLAPNFIPNQGQPVRHEEHANTPPAQRVESQHRVEPQHRTEPQRQTQAPRPVEVRTAQQIQFKRQERHAPVMPGYFRRDTQYYGHIEVPFPYADVDTSSFSVPDGFETVMVNGETFYYDRGIFYQQVGSQLVAIPPVLGAVVDSIPQDYEIVMADGVHYLYTGGVYYQRVDQGFAVVVPPVPEGLSQDQAQDQE